MTKPFSLEKKLEEIRQLVEKMQRGVSDFDQQVDLFKQGNQLIKECREYLDKSELKIEQLIKEEND
ncbi:MAG: exodeoxyribonuclease VII small subunit [Bacteroidetes bacterium]|nr:exodeoxyribonuclease VII small subunit [Bacteroidota bacterium]